METNKIRGEAKSEKFNLYLNSFRRARGVHCNLQKISTILEGGKLGISGKVLETYHLQ